MLSRALIEGLFGVRPDVLADELRVTPGFPADWDFARLRHPDVTVDFRRDGWKETFTIESRFTKPLALCLELAARGRDAAVTVDGKSAAWGWIDSLVAPRRIEVRRPPAARAKIVVTWRGLAESGDPALHREGSNAGPSTAQAPDTDWRSPLSAPAIQNV